MCGYAAAAAPRAPCSGPAQCTLAYLPQPAAPRTRQLCHAGQQFFTPSTSSPQGSPLWSALGGAPDPLHRGSLGDVRAGVRESALQSVACWRQGPSSVAAQLFSPTTTVHHVIQYSSISLVSGTFTQNTSPTPGSRGFTLETPIERISCSCHWAVKCSSNFTLSFRLRFRFSSCLSCRARTHICSFQCACVSR
jgi:hypothetical protein